ncbi:type II toxin-antitoxin system VapC family toxin [Crenothrix sp.]|uniref:type II toxin-antitoxin system VapC family toxin n=1 Tax=Crenothrix sp. TaxID=3100433 RepID=UPI00374D6F24
MSSIVAVDTNIIIRLAMRDDELQYQKVLSLIQQHQLFISRTVQLETEWVLRSRYKRTSVEIADFFGILLQKMQIICEDETALMNAICYYRLGADFADALHLANTPTMLFYTFDEGFCKKAIQEGIVSQVYLP